VEYI
jgi:hypothetical protein